jgi:hypothetical protein
VSVMQEMTREEKVETIARCCHAANLAWNDAHGERTLSWEAMRESICEGVEGALAGNTPEQSHQAWLRYKIEHGWQFGAVKSVEAKTHPLMIPYEQLPSGQRVKDDLFLAIVRSLAPALRLDGVER